MRLLGRLPADQRSLRKSSTVRKGSVWSLVVLIVLYSSLAAVGETVSERQRLVNRMADLLRQHPVVILGETHRRAESSCLVADVAVAFVERGGCLTVALEVAADQQSALHAGLHGTGPLAAVIVHPIIDHPAYREMLQRLHGLWATVPVKRRE